MRKLRYNAYQHIKEDQYLILFDRLLFIEQKVTPFLKSKKWNLKTSVTKTDGLATSFYCEDSQFYGSLSIVFDDNSEKLSFTSSISKSFDLPIHRYFLKHIIFEKKDISYFEPHIIRLFDEAIKIYDDWTKEDIIKYGY